MAIIVEVTVWFEAVHHWKNAPEDTAFLRTPHRHRFKVVAGVEVKGVDRQIEFHALQREIGLTIHALYGGDAEPHFGMFPYELGERSCEMIAREIMDNTPTELQYVSVSEDGENRAIITKE